jgi:hypothetical protein
MRKSRMIGGFAGRADLNSGVHRSQFGCADAAVYKTGYVATVTVEVRWAEASRAADASQAAYFRAALADERLTVTAALGQAKTRLRDCVERQEHREVVGLRAMARARLQVRVLEHQVRELDRMIAALDRRYSASLSDGR